MGNSLHEANRILLEKQAQARAARVADGRLPIAHPLQQPQPAAIDYAAQASAIVARRRHEAGLDAQYSPRPAGPARAVLGPLQANLQPKPAQKAYKQSGLQARIHPSELLELAPLGLFAQARLHAILRAIDASGRGLFPLESIEARLCRKASPEYLYGRRQLAKVLAGGEGKLWNRHKHQGRVFVHLIGRAKILGHFGIILEGAEIKMPLADLLANQFEHGRQREAAAMAAIYEAAHAGRRRPNRPMTRRAVKDATGLSRWRQWRYERRRGIRREAAWDYSAIYTEHKHQFAISHYGPGKFYRHVDYRGVINPDKPGQAYLARRIGNRFETLSRCSQIGDYRHKRRLNRASLRLCKYTHVGNDYRAGQVHYDSAEAADKVASQEIGRADARPAFVPIAQTGYKIQLYSDRAYSLDSHYEAFMRANCQSMGVF
jgi:hypothetical protein